MLQHYIRIEALKLHIPLTPLLLMNAEAVVNIRTRKLVQNSSDTAIDAINY